MGASMSTYVGWSVILGATGLYLLNESRKKNQREAIRAATLKQKQEERQSQFGRKENKETKPKRQRNEPVHRDSYASKVKQEAPAPAPAPAHPANDSSDEEIDNHEFARQLSNAKQGTKFTTKSKDENRQKSVKQSRAKETTTPVEQKKASAPSSTAGADADDDQSSAVASPTIAATKPGDVSDMLEPAIAGPSVLRLTGTEDKKAKENRAKVQQPTETKKQRQNRKKAEAAKAEREEAEKARKVLEEQTRRAARLAEGRAAKDGSGFVASQAANNAWANGVNGTSKVSTTPATSSFVQPLDTFEAKPAQANAAPKVVGTSSSDNWVASLPSEEEQVEAAMKDEDSWSTVKTKPRKSKKKEESVENVTTAAQAAQTAAPALAAKPQPANGRPAKPLHQTSSFAALTTEETADDDEEEEEWDV